MVVSFLTSAVHGHDHQIDQVLYVNEIPASIHDETFQAVGQSMVKGRQGAAEVSRAIGVANLKEIKSLPLRAIYCSPAVLLIA